MSAANSSMDTNYRKIYKKYENITDIFEYARKNGLNQITMAYLLKNSQIPQLELYRNIHELLELNIINVNEYNECPYCNSYNKANSHNMRCSRCQNIYASNDIIEKFELVRKIKNE